MTPLTRRAMHYRVRRMFLEELSTGQSTDFIDEENLPGVKPYEIDEAWDEAAQEQHLIVLDDAAQSGRLEDHANDYLQRYISRIDFNLVRHQAEYDSAVPSDVGAIIKVEVMGLRGIQKRPSDDRLIRNWPGQYGPGRNEMFWIVMANGISSPPQPSDVSRSLRVYVNGDTVNLVPALPLNTQTASLVYYRLVYATAYNSPPLPYTDSYDPWCDGVVHGATARLQEKAQMQSKSVYHYSKAREFAHNIFGNTQAQQGDRAQQGPNAG